MHIMVYGVPCFLAFVALILTVDVLLVWWTFPHPPVAALRLSVRLYELVTQPWGPGFLQYLDFRIRRLVLITFHPWTLGTLAYRLYRRSLNGKSDGGKAVQVKSPSQKAAGASDEGAVNIEGDSGASDSGSEDSTVRGGQRDEGSGCIIACAGRGPRPLTTLAIRILVPVGGLS